MDLITTEPAFSPSADAESNRYLWLEDRLGAKATKWAKQESLLTASELEKSPRFRTVFQETQKILTSKDKLPVIIAQADGWVYSVHQDEVHVRGLFRRTKAEDLASSEPEWEMLLDIDVLAAAEDTPWVLRGIEKLIGSQRCLLVLSRNGQDAAEFREFLLEEKKFPNDGFVFPESKSKVIWEDENHLLIASCLTTDNQTDSGYSRSVYRWKRGESFETAERLFHTTPDFTGAFVWVEKDQGHTHRFLGHHKGHSYEELFYLTPENELKQVPLPHDTFMRGVFDGHFLFPVVTPWNGFAVGTLVAVPLSFIGASEIPASAVEVVFTPSPRTAFNDVVCTSTRLFVLIDDMVKGKVFEAKREAATKTWSLTPIFGSEESSYNILTADKEQDAMIVGEEGYLQPRQLLLRKDKTTTFLRKGVSNFDESKFTTELLWTRSKDGTEIPYTLVRPKDMKYDGSQPTLLWAYGGFNITFKPTYSPTITSQWLKHGGAFVMGYIRGGGEFGPEWHHSARLENKQRSYDDFIAIAEDLIARKITSPRRLGIQGGSNGGLLMGAVTMQRPDLFNAVVCQVPLLDMIRYVNMPPGASWMSEYGDPADPKMREVILKYSPYQNISSTKKYPKVFFQTSQADDRVHPGHARKMVARMKELGHDVFYYEPTDGGHSGGGIKPEDMARTSAYHFTYLQSQLMD